MSSVKEVIEIEVPTTSRLPEKKIKEDLRKAKRTRDLAREIKRKTKELVKLWRTKCLKKYKKQTRRYRRQTEKLKEDLAFWKEEFQQLQENEAEETTEDEEEAYFQEKYNKKGRPRKLSSSSEEEVEEDPVDRDDPKLRQMCCVVLSRCDPTEGSVPEIVIDENSDSECSEAQPLELDVDENNNDEEIIVEKKNNHEVPVPDSTSSTLQRSGRRAAVIRRPSYREDTDDEEQQPPRRRKRFFQLKKFRRSFHRTLTLKRELRECLQEAATSETGADQLQRVFQDCIHEMQLTFSTEETSEEVVESSSAEVADPGMLAIPGPSEGGMQPTAPSWRPAAALSQEDDLEGLADEALQTLGDPSTPMLHWDLDVQELLNILGPGEVQQSEVPFHEM